MKRLLLLKPIQQSLLLVVVLLLSIEASVGQAISVSGRVTAKNNEGIPAATVLVKGTTTC